MKYWYILSNPNKKDNIGKDPYIVKTIIGVTDYILDTLSTNIH